MNLSINIMHKASFHELLLQDHLNTLPHYTDQVWKQWLEKRFKHSLGFKYSITLAYNHKHNR